jgi:VCBS repeat-containing protein
MKSSLKLSAAAIATTLMLTACGGGGGEGGQTNSNGNGQSAATINGQYSATMQEGASSAASGKLSYSAGGGFARPASLQGTYGAFTFNELTGDWTYLVNNSSPATIALVTGQSVIDSLVINSADKAATITITITIEGNSPKTDGIAPVQNVPAPSYASTDRYAADKVAVFEMLNADRARCGFGKVAQSPKLDTAAQAHSDYLALNKSTTNRHNETSSLPGYTGYGPGDRITKTGYDWLFATEILHQADWGSIFSTGININNRPMKWTPNLGQVFKWDTV